MEEILTPGDKALRWAQENVRESARYDAVEAYKAGYSQAEKDNPLRWRDPRKEKPDTAPIGLAFVLAAVWVGTDFPRTMELEYESDGKWTCFLDGEEGEVDPSDVLAWMPVPRFRREVP